MVVSGEIQWIDFVGATVKCIKSDKLKEVPEYKLLAFIPEPDFNKPIFKGTRYFIQSNNPMAILLLFQFMLVVRIGQ